MSAAVAASLLLASPASAHVTITPSTAAAGATSVLQVAFQHGCDGSPTTAVTIRIPQGINAVAPTMAAGWDVDKELETLDPPIVDGHGAEISDRVASVTFQSDEPVPDGFRQVFELSLQLPETEGDTLVFPTVQTCETGELAWIEVAGNGEDLDELEYPAPTIITEDAAGENDHDHGQSAAGDGTAHAHGDAANEATGRRPQQDGATPADNSDALAVGGLVAGLLGLVAGGAALLLQRRNL